MPTTAPYKIRMKNVNTARTDKSRTIPGLSQGRNNTMCETSMHMKIERNKDALQPMKKNQNNQFNHAFI